MSKGDIIPPDLCDRFMRKVFTKEGPFGGGFLLDGHPRDVQGLRDLLEGVLPSADVQMAGAIVLQAPREVCEARLKGRMCCKGCGATYHTVFSPPPQGDVCSCGSPVSLSLRLDDSQAKAIDQRLDKYQLSSLPVVQKLEDGEIRPPHQKHAVKVVRVDASASIEDVTKNIVNAFHFLRTHQGTYTLDPLSEASHSTVFHNHIDAESHDRVLQILKEVESKCPRSAQNTKIYPISHLHLGPQTSASEFKGVYGEMPNFHRIETSTEEAFTTGRMDSHFDVEWQAAVLEVCVEHGGHGVMTEVEEDIFDAEWNWSSRGGDESELGELVVGMDRLDNPEENPLPSSLLEKYRSEQILPTPRFELHHGFDIPFHLGGRVSTTVPPIALTDLMEKSGKTEEGAQGGLNVGGMMQRFVDATSRNTEGPAQPMTQSHLEVKGSQSLFFLLSELLFKRLQC
uniref:Adenylate kinase active site lid domain-containing protein n=1 Tax=Chromera velia CCMP2878 TaxID=1169474 RepID=A0A0G4G6X4_9ALVE|eukprot:Cvel_20571.t1-p1 / transcript=Cvel_20571.t1 / gene=Cvel_20571 / organism=Chromera_velia_CCMP2878 / gene_product=Adenylate kinase, putative / transcript_product=Adenylate kinase, putative / location=Cvel_scaffold1858:7142-12516(-) / protein_length=453 / sequence_SO=supercontig / SO=protein_coding / is_pseudo=false